MAGALRTTLTDAEEATRAAAHDRPDSFDELYAEYFPFVWRCLRGLGVAEPARDDAAQEVFLVVHRRLAEFAGQSSFRTWLFGVVRRVAFNQRRSASRKRAGEQVLDTAAAAPGLGPLEHAQNLEAAAFVEQFVGRLPKGQREVFMLVLIEEMTIPEVAEALSIRLNTAYTWLRRARASFRQAMAECRTREAMKMDDKR
jgi:RNA polymerase sigma-70 factor (ECF subfamily)